MNRSFIATLFALSAAGLALFLWQKQAANYNFSLDKEKEVFKSFRESSEEYGKNLPSFEISDELRQEFEKFRLEKYGPPSPEAPEGQGTTTPQYAATTTSENEEEELRKFLLELGP